MLLRMPDGWTMPCILDAADLHGAREAVRLDRPSADPLRLKHPITVVLTLVSTGPAFHSKPAKR